MNKMTPDEYEQLKRKIAKANEAAIRAEGSLEQIKQQGEKDLGVSDKKEAQQKIQETEKIKEKKLLKVDKLVEELSSIADWDAI